MAIPRGYVRIPKDSLPDNYRLSMKSALMICPVSTSSFKENTTTIRMYEEQDGFIGVPRGFFLKHIAGRLVPNEFSPCMGEEVRDTPPFELREGQPEVVDAAYRQVTSFYFGGAVIEAKTGAGKTVLGCEMARRLARKTLVVVHTSVLMNQWRKEIMRFLPGWEIGKLQADEIDIKGKDIVLGMLHSLAFKEYPQWVYEQFGTLIVDEVHVTGAAEFSKLFPKFPAKYMIGLSGTLRRPDRAEEVFLHSIGPVVSGMKSIEVLKPKVYFINTQYLWEPAEWHSKWAIDKQKPMMLKNLTRNRVRNELIVRQAVKAAEAGRNVLILSDRVVQLEELAREIKSRVSPDSGVTVGILIGAKTQAERDQAQKCQVICATVQLVGTGFNEPRMDTLIFASPIQSIEQPVGRILRKCEGKRDPIVLDLVDRKIEMCVFLARSRLKKYREKGWDVVGADALRNT